MKQKDLFDKIWTERPHYSEFSGEELGEEAKSFFFAHVLAKGAYPNFKCYEQNIVLLTMREHMLLDGQTQPANEEERDLTIALRQWIEIKAEPLRIIYNKIQSDPVARLTYSWKC